MARALIGQMCAVLIAVVGCVAGAADRPNVLWIVVEDLSPWMPLYGDNTVKTPHLDKLAGDGVVFTNCFATGPVCSISRSALITGMMQTTLGLHQHRSGRTPKTAIHLPEGFKTIPERFRAAGYFTYNHGKDDYNFTYDRDKLYSDGHKPRSFGFYGVHGYGDWTERKAGQPFFGQVMLLGDKYKGEVDDPVDPATVKVPPYYPDVPTIRAAIARYYDKLRVTDGQAGELIQRLKDDGLYESTIIVFTSDHGMSLPRHKSLCYDGGLHVPLIVAWPGNPKAIGGAGKVRDDLCSLVDLGAASLALAGLEVPGDLYSRDLFAPGYKRDFVVASRDRLDWCIDNVRALRTSRYKYIRNYLTDRPALHANDYRAGRREYKAYRKLFDAGKLTEAQSLILQADRPAEELYDLRTDPDELRNLAADPTYAATLAKLRKDLKVWRLEYDQPGMKPMDDAQLRAILKRWGKRCVMPEFDRVR